MIIEIINRTFIFGFINYFLFIIDDTVFLQKHIRFMMCFC